MDEARLEIGIMAEGGQAAATDDVMNSMITKAPILPSRTQG